MAALTLTCSNAAPSEARRWTVKVLERGLPDVVAATALVGDAVLCVSELVTNAVRAGCGQVTLRIEHEPDEVQLAIADDAPGSPVLTPAATDSLRGRGLAIIAALAADWGVRNASPGKEVWVRLALPV
jgi:anti-sigma regulatory factor (Ser/Thr protein kinase)